MHEFERASHDNSLMKAIPVTFEATWAELLNAVLRDSGFSVAVGMKCPLVSNQLVLLRTLTLLLASCVASSEAAEDHSWFHNA